MADEPETLNALLVETTGQPEEEVWQKLQELTARIGEVARTGNSFHIKDLGTFTGHYGSLYFEPSEQLQTEINHRYAGMPPIELVEAFKETGSGVPVEQRLEPSSSLQEEGHHPDYIEEPAPVPEIEEMQAVNADMAVEETEKAADAAGEAKETVATKKIKKEYTFDRRKNGRGTWIAAAVLFIVIILAVGWLFFTNRLAPKKEVSQTTTAAPVDSVNSQSLAGNQAEDLRQTPVSGSPSTGDLANKKSAAGDSLAAQYGLMGNRNQQIDNAYTIVIHSFRLKTTIQKIANTLSEEGYRAIIFHGTTDNDIHWRLGLGQFKTIKDAQQAVRELPERYQKAHFIHRINH
jgi:cell division septation protein DedD